MSATGGSKPASEFPDLIEALQKAPEQERNDRKEVLEKIARSLDLDQTQWETKEDTVWLVAYVIKSNPDFLAKEERGLIIPQDRKTRVLTAWDKFKEAIKEVPLGYIEAQVQPLHQTRREYRELLKQFEKIEISVEDQVTEAEKKDAEALGKIVLKAISEAEEVKPGKAHIGWRTIKREDLPNNELSAISRQAGEIVNYKEAGQIELPQGVHIKVNGRQQSVVKYGDTLNIPVFPRHKKDEKPPAKGVINVKVGVPQDERNRKIRQFIDENKQKLHPRDVFPTNVEKVDIATEAKIAKEAHASDRDDKAYKAAITRQRGYIPLVIKTDTGDEYEIYRTSFYKGETLREEGQKRFMENLAKGLAVKIAEHNKNRHPDAFERIADDLCTTDYKGEQDGFKDENEEKLLNQLKPFLMAELEILKAEMTKEIGRLATVNFRDDWEGSELYGVENEKAITKTQLAWAAKNVLSLGLPPKDEKNQIRLRGINVSDIEQAAELNETFTLELLAKEIIRIVGNDAEKLYGGKTRLERIKDWIEQKAFFYTMDAAPRIPGGHRNLVARIKQEAPRQIDREIEKENEARYRRMQLRRNSRQTNPTN